MHAAHALVEPPVSPATVGAGGASDAPARPAPRRDPPARRRDDPRRRRAGLRARPRAGAEDDREPRRRQGRRVADARRPLRQPGRNRLGRRSPLVLAARLDDSELRSSTGNGSRGAMDAPQRCGPPGGARSRRPAHSALAWVGRDARRAARAAICKRTARDRLLRRDEPGRADLRARPRSLVPADAGRRERLRGLLRRRRLADHGRANVGLHGASTARGRTAASRRGSSRMRRSWPRSRARSRSSGSRATSPSWCS